jgi:thiamine biosynthesis protein ThiS
MSTQITLNGEDRTFPAPLTVTRLVEALELPPQGLAVEVNLEIVPRSQWADRELAEGDRVEIVTFVGGG